MTSAMISCAPVKPARQLALPPFEVADLFCGGGGTSTGILRAARRLNRTVNLLAINHWPAAIAAHSLNHPHVRHLCESLDNLDPRRLVKRLHLLAASPECTHHSNARGGKPRSEQSRATAWHVLRWAEAVPVENIIIENVPELQSWGPLGRNGKPLKRKKGRLFKTFIEALRALDYHVDWRIITAADYGDPTTRERLIILCRKAGPVPWPATTHAPREACPSHMEPWHTASEIIDWELSGRSIFQRAHPLKANTLARILAGVRHFSGPQSEPFLIQMRGTAPGQIRRSPRLMDEPLPTITAGEFHTRLVQPFLIHTTHHGSHRFHSLQKPAPTITGAHRGELALVEPRLMQMLEPESDGEAEPVLDADCCRLVGRGTNRTIAKLDILFRMLQPHELAAGMSFPPDYEFTGTKEDKVRMIGNSVPVETAAAMAGSLLSVYAFAE